MLSHVEKNRHAQPLSSPSENPLLLVSNPGLKRGERDGDAVINRWNARLNAMLKAEKALQRANRLRKVSAAVIVVSTTMLIFALSVTPDLSPVWFISALAVGIAGLLTFPVSWMLSLVSRQHRDTLSRKFYESNHEVALENNHLVVINRGNYKAVTRVPVLDL